MTRLPTWATVNRLLYGFWGLTVIDVLQTIYATRQGCYELSTTSSIGLSNFLLFKIAAVAVVSLYLLMTQTRWIALFAVLATSITVLWNTAVISLLLVLGPIC